MSKFAAKIQNKHLKSDAVRTHITMYPRTPDWTDRSRNGRGFLALALPEPVRINANGRSSRRN